MYWPCMYSLYLVLFLRNDMEPKITATIFDTFSLSRYLSMLCLTAFEGESLRV